MSRPRLCSCVPRPQRASSPSAGHFDHTFIKGRGLCKGIGQETVSFMSCPSSITVCGWQNSKDVYWPPLMTHRRKSRLKIKTASFVSSEVSRTKSHVGSMVVVLLLSWPGWGALNRKLVPLSQSQLSSACISSISAASVDTDISMTRERQSNYPSLGMNGLCPNPF